MRSLRGPRAAAGVALACAGALWLGTASAAADTTVFVNTTLTNSATSDGLCSLAEAVDYSDGGSDPDCSTTPRSGTTTIKLPAGHYALAATLGLIHPTDITGAGAGSTDIDGSDAVQVVHIASTATVEIDGVEISGGDSGHLSAGCTGSGSTLKCPPEQGGIGGGILNLGTLTLRNAAVSNNRAGDGTGRIGLWLCLGSCAGVDGAGGGSGGGIYNAGTLNVESSTITGNQAGQGGPGGGGVGTSAAGGNGSGGGSGGAIDNDGGHVTIADSTIAGNAAGAGGSGGNGVGGGNGGDGGFGGSGGAIVSGSGGFLTITGSTFAGNTAGNGNAPGSGGSGGGTGGNPGDGGAAGAIEFNGGSPDPLVMTNDTLAGNASGTVTQETVLSHAGVGGALALDGPGTLTDVTIAGNTGEVGGALYDIPGSAITVSDSVIASNVSTDPSGGNCDGAALLDGGHDITYGDAAGPTCPGTVADPRLQLLAGNGGPTQTMRLGSGSPAIDVVPASACGIAVDQRGIARPQGTACDAGAYEVAPPALTAAPVQVSGPASASLSGQVVANLTDTSVTVRYGTTTAYGTSTAATDAGSGSGAKPFAIALTGLTPGTTYHAQVVATNTDGTTTSADTPFTTPVATPGAATMTASVPKSTIDGEVLLVKLSCAAGGRACSGALKLSSRVTTRRGKVVAVAASGSQRKKARRKTAVRTVGSGRYTLAAGQTQVVRLSLNGTGKRLLRARHRLPARLTSTGPAHLNQKITFVYKRSRGKKR